MAHLAICFFPLRKITDIPVNLSPWWKNIMAAVTCKEDKGQNLLLICDMIKGNESLVENFNSYFLTPLPHNFNMLHFDANPHYNWISGYSVIKNLSI